MNDAIEHAFKYLHESEVPDGPPDQLVQATVVSLREASRYVPTYQRMRHWKVAVPLAAAAAFVFALTFVTIRNADRANSQSEPVLPQPGVSLSQSGTSAFIESDRLEAGQTFLLPLSGAPVCVDRSSWPDDLLTINSLAEQVQ